MEGCFKIITSTLMLISLQCISADAANDTSALQQEVKHVLTHMILHHSYPKCSTVDLSSERLVCEIWDEEDENSLHYLCSCGRGGELSVEQAAPCPDGSVQKVCVPQVTDYNNFLCACKSLKKEPIDTDYLWDAEWREIEGPRTGLFRRLCTQATWSCVAAEYKFDLAHLVKYIPLPDDRIKASSKFNSATVPKRVRIDNYFSRACGWVGADGDQNKWVQFDMIRAYMGVGVLIRRRCDESKEQAVTEFKVGFSNDTTQWQYSETIKADYGKSELAGHLSFTHWFPEPYLARYWRIYPLKFLNHPSLKADIIGGV